MTNESIKTRILAEYTTLLAIKFDSPLVVADKLKLISEHIAQLTGDAPDQQKEYSQAAELLESARQAEYVAYTQAQTNDEKEQTLAELKHKVAQACQLLHIHG